MGAYLPSIIARSSAFSMTLTRGMQNTLGQRFCLWSRSSKGQKDTESHIYSWVYLQRRRVSASCDWLEACASPCKLRHMHYAQAFPRVRYVAPSP